MPIINQPMQGREQAIGHRARAGGKGAAGGFEHGRSREDVSRHHEIGRHERALPGPAG